MLSDPKQVVRQLFEDVWTRGNLAELTELMDAECVCRSAAETPLLKGVDAYRQFVAAYLVLHGNLRITVEQQVIEDDLVATRWTAWQTGEDVETGSGLMGMSFHRVREGRIIEAWDTWDTFRATEAASGADPIATLAAMHG